MFVSSSVACNAKSKYCNYQFTDTRLSHNDYQEPGDVGVSSTGLVSRATRSSEYFQGNDEQILADVTAQRLLRRIDNQFLKVIEQICFVFGWQGQDYPYVGSDLVRVLLH